MLTAPAEALFKIEELTIDLPAVAEIHESVTCDRCGEPVMSTRTRKVAGSTLCIPCASSEAGLPGSPHSDG